MVDGKSHTPCRSLISLLVDETGRTDSSCGALGGGGVALDRSISRRVLGLGRGSSPARGGSGEGLRSDLPGHAKRYLLWPTLTVLMCISHERVNQDFNLDVGGGARKTNKKVC
jgi:hypothetical protein